MPLILLLAALAAYDVASTLYALRLGAVEKNQLLLRLFAMWPGREAEVLLGTKLAAAAAVGVAAYHGELPEWVLLGVVILYAVVAVNNTLVIMRMREERAWTRIE